MNHPYMLLARSAPFVSIVLGLVAVASAAHAVPISIANPSFEDPNTPNNSFNTSAPPAGWQVYGSIDNVFDFVGVLNPNDTTLYLDPVPEGRNVAVTFLLPSFTNTPAGIQQTLSATLQTMTDYTLVVEVGNLGNDPHPNNMFNFTGFPGYRIDLLAGATVIASDNNSLAPADGRFATSTVQVSIGASHPNAGQALTVRLVNLDSAPGIEVNFDDVHLDAVSNVATATPTLTPTQTPTSTPTQTPTSTPTPTPTEVPTSAPCPETLPPSCKAALSGKAKLTLGRNLTNNEKNSLTWKWIGDATTLMEFGDPLATTDYRVCLYDGGGEILFNLTAVAASLCDGRPCWKESGSGFTYRDRSGSAAGLRSLGMKAGAAGRATLKLKAKGDNLAIVDLPPSLTPNPLRVMLLNEESGTCWLAQYSTLLGDPASATKWRARND